jgi:predicted metal-binding membrane protein
VESASLRRGPPLPGLIRLGLIGTLLLLAAVGWLVTDERMAGMDSGPGTDPGTLGFWVSAWVVMMGAMMFPSIAPMVLMYARIQEGKRAKGAHPLSAATTIFVSGYLLVWSVAGMAGYALVWLGHELSPGFLGWDAAGPYVAGAVIVAAAIYQLTPLKDVCLSKCRSPFAFLLSAWKPGRVGALRMGIEHGGWCVGCCWALMAALIALGVMSVGWMVLVAALIAVEKLLPWKVVANRSIAILLAVLGLAVAFVPADVPGLTVPSEATGSDR